MHKNSLTLAVTLLALSMPAFAANENAPDNTKHNKVENQGATAENQSNKKADVKLTASLRRKIMRQKGLSLDAKNIKIISENGSLVLRGPVKTEAEKQIIDGLAKQCCTTVSYRNELEVKNQ